MDPADLEPNGGNWRAHPQAQLVALKDVVAEVGWAGALLWNERTKRLVDGHARRELFAGQKVPVLVGSWTEEQERKILATLDPLAAMAEADTAKLAALLAEIDTESAAMGDMLAKLAQDEGITPPDFQPASIDEQGRLDEKAKTKCPECGHEFTP